MNKSHEKRRVALGKPAKIANTSLEGKYYQDDNIAADGQQLGQQAFVDMTDVENDEVSHDARIPSVVADGRSSSILTRLVVRRYAARPRRSLRWQVSEKRLQY